MHGYSQGVIPEILPIRIQIETRLVAMDQKVDWSNVVDQRTLNGKPVIVRIDGDNFRLRVTFTSYYQDGISALLIAQTEVFHGDEEKSGWDKSLLSQVVKLGVPLYFYPLGKERRSEEGHSMVMEILLTKETGQEGSSQ